MARTTRSRMIVVGASFVVSLFAGACGAAESPGTPASSAPTTFSAPTRSAGSDAASAKDMSANPCEIVTAADLAAARNGVTYHQSVPGTPQIVGSFSERSCAYESSGGSQVLVTTTIDDAPAGTVWQAIVPIITGSPHDVVTGIGDEAYLEQESSITVRKGKVILDVSFLGDQLTAAVKQQLKEVATQAALRM